MVNRTYRWLLITLAVVGLGADLGSKYGVFRWLYKDGNFAHGVGNEYDVVPGWFKLIAQFDREAPITDDGFSDLRTWSTNGDPVMPRVNHGALFGLGQSRKGLANGFFAVVSVAAALAILVWGTRQHTARERGLMAALGLILGGTVGNLYDRLVFGGVRDFLYFYKIEWPVFNVADCCLVVGAVLLLVQAVLVSPAAEPPAKTSEPAAPVSESPKV
ncbi:signal peptidase II [Gemmata sp. JC673]|uniref:Lipoprotein signal peptidase n=1 Tax=Gemmata algarum TaxID=2975278 RepID=A0ABU5EZK9_9BACT|nr:signal peptidase II [Gemmata algarum]MDY3560740.1 signal peptidase II [Gemmata algarum]